VQNPSPVLSTEQLQERRSAKWRKYDPDVSPVWVAEMDTPLAASGPAFGDLGRGYARLNFATSPQRLEEVLARMAAGVSNTAHSVGDTSVLPGL
jgi:bifunctional pyridoxal-dependent enzyme with beta-cystathionase and maltose regulon repressor activities